MRHIPPLSLAAAALIIMTCPSLQALLVYDREAIAAGEIWRIATCHIVHFSWSHLIFNIVGLFISFDLARRCRYCGIDTAVIAAALLISGALWSWQPEMARYGGLSGLVNAAIAYVAAMNLRERNKPDRLWLAVLAGLAVNTIYEAVTATPSFARACETPFVPSVMAHAVGAATGVCFSFLKTKRKNNTWQPVHSINM